MADDERKGNRGSGIHVRGGFRLRDFHLSFDATTGELVSSSLNPELRADMFPFWLQVAEASAGDAEAARREAIEAAPDEKEKFNDALEREFRASLITVAASAFALDAFYASVVLHAPTTKVVSRTRDGSIFETLKRAFTMTAKQQANLRDFLKTLFRLRDEAVHPKAAWLAPIAHPVFGLGMEPRIVHFRAENAVNGQLHARRIVWFCLHKPKKKHKDLVTWCDALKDQFTEPPLAREWEDGPTPRRRLAAN
jgi:hypothetical protein